MDRGDPFDPPEATAAGSHDPGWVTVVGAERLAADVGDRAEEFGRKTAHIN